MNSKKELYFYLGYFGINSIISIIASIYGITQSLFYIIDLILTLLLSGLYFYVYFRKIDYLAPFSQFIIFYGFINLIVLLDFWPFMIIALLGIINFIGIIIYYYINNRRNKRF